VLQVLVGLGHIHYDIKTAKYSNTPEGSDFCVKSSPLYIGQALQTLGNIERCDFKNLSTYLAGKHHNPIITDFGSFYDAIPDLPTTFAGYMENTCKFVSFIIPR